MTILAVAEHRRGELRDVSLQLASACRDLADVTGEECHLAVVGAGGEDYAERLDRPLVDVVHAIDPGEAGAGFDHDVYVEALAEVVADVDPAVVLGPHTAAGLDYVPALASRLDRPLVTDAVDLAHDGDLTVTRELYGSKVETTLDVHADRAVVTVRPGEWPPASGDGDARVETVSVTVPEDRRRATVQGYEEVAAGDVDITEADVLVAVGRGIGEEENLELIFDLAETLDATVAASRPIVDNGWLEPARQVGQSGKVVTPDVYLAIGISGAVQHVAGMKGADTIVAINDDPSAPIFDLADYGIVDDLFDVVPALIDAWGE